MTTKTKFILLLILLSTSFLYFFDLKKSLFYHPDFARDMHEILRISQGKIVLVGPKLTFGGLYLGPYYFYLFVPAYLIGGKEIISVHIFNLLLFVTALAFLFKKATEKFGMFMGMLTTLVTALLPMYVIGARNPSNAYSFIPIFSILLAYLYFNREERISVLTFLGFVYGMIVNFHFLNSVFLPALLIWLWGYFKDKRKILFFLAGLSVSFLPLILFELKHDFVMLKNTFIDKSYLNWVNMKNLPAGFEAKKNIVANFFFLSNAMKQYLGVNPLILYVLIGVCSCFQKPDKTQRLLFIGSLLTLLLIAVIIRFQFIPHYLFGISFFLFLNFLIIILRFKNELLFAVVFIFLLVFELFSFPKYVYRPSWRTPERFERAVDFAIKNKLVSKSNFNIIQITKENLLATLGFEYRYFFRKAGYQADSEFLYNRSKELIIFSEIPYSDIGQFSSWEAEQFGKRYFLSAKMYKLKGLTIYKISK